MLAIPGCYRSLVETYHIPIVSAPSWDTLTVLENRTEMDAVRSLASRGFTFDEADDATEYASQYMQDVVRDSTAPPAVSNPQSTAVIDMEMAKSADGTTGPPVAP